MKHIILILFVITSSSSVTLAQNTDTVKTAPRQLTEQERAAYERTFRDIEHPPAYYNLNFENQVKYDVSMHKAKSYKTKGWILVGAGVALAGIGFAIPTKENDFTKPAFFIIGGLAAIAGTTCLLVSSGKKKKAHAVLKLGMQSPASSSSFHPEFGISINI